MNSKTIALGVGAAGVVVLLAIFQLSSPAQSEKAYLTDKSALASAKDKSQGDHNVPGNLAERNQQTLDLKLGGKDFDRASDSARTASSPIYRTGSASRANLNPSTDVAVASFDPIRVPSEVTTEPVEPRAAEVYLPTVSLPAPFLPLPDSRNWSADDVAGVAALAKDFTDSVVSSGQSPSDPAYYHAWLTAEWLANERYRSYYGVDAFNALRNPDG